MKKILLITVSILWLQSSFPQGSRSFSRGSYKQKTDSTVSPLKDSTGIDSSNILKTDFAFYTDFLGVGNDRPNGLYQIELGFKIPLNTKQKFNMKIKPDENINVQLFRSFYFTMNMTHLDNLLTEDVTNNSAKPQTKTDSSTQLGIDTIIKSNASGMGGDTSFNPIYAKKKLINSFDLYQWASFMAELKLNLLTLRWPRHHFYFSYTFAFLRTPIFDSLIDKRIHITSIMHGPDIFYETDFKIGNPLFNVRVNASYRWLKLWNNDLQQINSPVFQYTKENPYRDYFEDKKLAKIFETSFRIAYEYNSSDTVNNHNQIFMRISNSLQTPSVNGIKFHNNFTQFQFGGVFDIGTMLKKVQAPKA